MHAPNGNPEVVWRGISFVRARPACFLCSVTHPGPGAPTDHAFGFQRASRSRIRLLARQQASRKGWRQGVRRKQGALTARIERLG